MTLGPRPWVRCDNKPAWIATEGEREDGRKPGSMALCDDCRKVCEQALPGATYEPIRKEHAKK